MQENSICNSYFQTTLFSQYQEKSQLEKATQKKSNGKNTTWKKPPKKTSSIDERLTIITNVFYSCSLESC